MDKEESIIDAVEEEIIEKVTPSQHSSSQNKLDIRYSMYDCMVGLTPGRLSCKNYLIIGKETLTFPLVLINFMSNVPLETYPWF